MKPNSGRYVEHDVLNRVFRSLTSKGPFWGECEKNNSDTTSHKAANSSKTDTDNYELILYECSFIDATVMLGKQIKRKKTFGK